jgi:ribosomal-protein-serine acetyltransferase
VSLVDRAAQLLPERIEGDGVLLRRWCAGDAEALARAITESEDHLRPWMGFMAHEPQTLEIGYWVHPAFTRRGLGTTVARLLTGAALSIPEIAHVEIHTDKANTASAGVPRRLGYRLVAETPDGRRAPAEVGIEHVWRMDQDDWERRLPNT